MDEVSPRVAEARRRWRAAGDRLWPVAMSDGESYQEVAVTVGALVDALRERVGSLDELVDLDLRGFLDGLGTHGVRAQRQPDLLAAACSVHADELAARHARARRVERIEQARSAGEAWVVVDSSPTRSVEMHVGSGIALVATADPYAGAEPYRLAEVTLDPGSGAGVDDGSDEVAFASREQWEAACAQRRDEVGRRLDSRESGVSDR